MKELNQVELEQISGAGFWGDLCKGLVSGVESILESVATGLHNAHIISDDVYNGAEKVIHAGAKQLDNVIDKSGL
ncbi:hypothetical protein Xbed_00187 [Xenorhabdus beddingii]|uniref:Bacteriocin n=1 Tax=Xenorhabdus beddingii TaxID=40578 RepID=A0A1Y2SS18_9GAMM|nr:hypothetical protein [Xenorhabdus beddingii]OTA21938.1 hypothetical protein Xbed_00187 [Xenorhabdus beddingii]